MWHCLCWLVWARLELRAGGNGGCRRYDLVKGLRGWLGQRCYNPGCAYHLATNQGEGFPVQEVLDSEDSQDSFPEPHESSESFELLISQSLL